MCRRPHIETMVMLVATWAIALLGISDGRWLESVSSRLSMIAVVSALAVLVMLHRAARRHSLPAGIGAEFGAEEASR